MIEYLDSHQNLETLIKRDYGSDKFVISVILEDGSYSTYIPGGLTDPEIIYIIQCLKDRREYIFNSEDE